MSHPIATGNGYCHICDGAEPKPSKCIECDGSGYVECEYGHEHECPSCYVPSHRRRRGADASRKLPELCDLCWSIGSVEFAREHVLRCFLEGLNTEEQRWCVQAGAQPRQTTLGTFAMPVRPPSELEYRWTREIASGLWTRTVSRYDVIDSVETLAELRGECEEHRRQQREQWLRGAA